MKEKKSKPKAIDLFAGCGGLTYGLKAGGFQVVGAVEVDEIARKTYRLNHRKVDVKEDIRDVDAAEWMTELGLVEGELDLMAGCPPCQGFSTLRTLNGAKQNRDKRNRLVEEMLRLISAFKPKAVMMENVPGLEDRLVFRDFMKELKKLGYKACHDIHNVYEYGVPQRRRRLIVLGGLGFSIPFADPVKNLRNVRNAIGKLPKAGESGDLLHDMPERRSEKVMKIIKAIPKDGGSRSALPAHLRLDCHERCDGFKDIYGRMAWDKPAPTITGGCFNPSKGRFLHPDYDRCITMREAALLQTFPKSFRVPNEAGKQQIALMIGNALPPKYIERNAKQIVKALMRDDQKHNKQL